MNRSVVELAGYQIKNWFSSLNCTSIRYKILHQQHKFTRKYVYFTKKVNTTRHTHWNSGQTNYRIWPTLPKKYGKSNF